jgi:hypothetical protein
MTDDGYDRDWVLRAVMAADAAYRLMRRRSTQRVVDAGFLDEDAVKDLTERLDEFHMSRMARINQARRDNGTTS